MIIIFVFPANITGWISEENVRIWERDVPLCSTGGWINYSSEGIKAGECIFKSSQGVKLCFCVFSFFSTNNLLKDFGVK